MSAVFRPLAGLVWHVAAAGWWASRGWYAVRPALLAVGQNVRPEKSP